MDRYLSALTQGYSDYAAYLWQSVSQPAWNNYFYWLTGISVVFLLLEWARPWRKAQPRFRQDFWLDAGYMYFNYFLFSLIVFAGLSRVGVTLFGDLIGIWGWKNIVAIHLEQSPVWVQILVLFVVADFVQWWTHRLLHAVPWLWELHKVHHSVEQMGFAAHLRYHWMENVVYKLTQFIPLSMIGYDVQDLFALYMFNTVVGHYNHANITVPGWLKGGLFGGMIGLVIGVNAFEINLFLDASAGEVIGVTAVGMALGALALGPIMRFLFNSPEMHIWHHAHDMPDSHPRGINFGLTLAIWDYIFRTAHIPHSGRDIALGFPGIKHFPKSFLGQLVYGFVRRK